MRTFNGLQAFTQQLTNSGQLDLRYVRMSGNDYSPNLNEGVRVGSYIAPLTQNSPGTSGQFAWDQSYFYICLSGNGVSTGSWKRLTLENF